MKLLVWDFDWTLVDQNSDPWSVTKLGAYPIFKDAMKKVEEIGFTAVMDETFRRAHEEIGYTEADVYDACSSLPMDSSLRNVVKRIKTERAGEVESVIVSDANNVLIDNALRHFEIKDCFSSVHTNKAHFEESGCLRVEPYCPPEEPHGCPLCPKNLCKGKVLLSLTEQMNPDQVIYLGDGNGDFCPCTKLGPKDLIFARMYYPQDHLLIIPWTNQSDLATLLINQIF